MHRTFNNTTIFLLAFCLYGGFHTTQNMMNYQCGQCTRVKIMAWCKEKMRLNQPDEQFSLNNS